MRSPRNIMAEKLFVLPFSIFILAFRYYPCHRTKNVKARRSQGEDLRDSQGDVCGVVWCCVPRTLFVVCIRIPLVRRLGSACPPSDMDCSRCVFFSALLASQCSYLNTATLATPLPACHIDEYIIPALPCPALTPHPSEKAQHLGPTISYTYIYLTECLRY